MRPLLECERFQALHVAPFFFPTPGVARISPGVGHEVA